MRTPEQVAPLDCCLTSLLALIVTQSRPPFPPVHRPMALLPVRSPTRRHHLACSSHRWGAYGLWCCSMSLKCCRETNTTRDILLSAAAWHSMACCSRRSGSCACCAIYLFFCFFGNTCPLSNAGSPDAGRASPSYNITQSHGVRVGQRGCGRAKEGVVRCKNKAKTTKLAA